MAGRSRPKTGEPRKTHQPLKIDRLPEPVKEAILTLAARGRTWLQIEEQSAKSYSPDWAKDGGGFIDWTLVDPDVLDLFDGLKLGHTTLHRWHDLRFAQVRKQVLAESETARAFAEKFASATITDANESVINALRDEVFKLSGEMDTMSRARYMGALQDLTLAMTRIQRVQLQKRKVEADIAKSETERARIAAQSGDPHEVYLKAANDLLKKLRTREHVRVVLDPIKDELVQEISNGAEAFARQIEATAV